MADEKQITVKATFVDNVSTGVNKMAANTSSAMSSVGKSASGMALAIKSAGLGMLGFAGISTLTSFLSQSTKDFKEAEKAEKDFAAAITGTVVDVDAATKQFQEFTLAIQDQTRFEDDALLSAMAYGKNLGIQTGQLKEATVAAIGLATKYRIDLQSAMQLVGRASQGQTQMLAKYGIVLGKNLSPQEKFNELLKIGAGAFDLAKKDAQSYTGQLDQMQNKIGNLKEQIGERLIPIQVAWNELLLKATNMLANFFTVPPTPKVATQLQATTDVLADLNKELTVLTSDASKGVIDMWTGKFIPATDEAAVQYDMLTRRIRLIRKEIEGLKKPKEEVTLSPPSKEVSDEEKKRLEEQKELRQKTNMEIHEDYMQIVLSERDFAIRQENVKYEQRFAIIQGNLTAEEELYNTHMTNLAKINYDFDQKEAEDEKARSDKGKKDLADERAMVMGFIDEQISGALELTDMFKEHNKDVFALSKGLAIAKATMNTYTAISSALEPYVPGFSELRMAMASALGFAQVAKIMNTQYKSAALGADFVTQGRQTLIVGDNPGGRERVQVTPIGSPNIYGSKGSGMNIDSSITIQGNVTPETMPLLSKHRERQIDDMRRLFKEMKYAGQFA